MANSVNDALLTTRYGNWKKPIASPNSFQASLPFVPSDDKSGSKFSMPILTAISQGATTDNTGNVVALNGSRPGQNSQAVLDGVNLYMQEQLSYSDLMKMANGSSESGDSAAYSSGPDWVMFSMLLGLKHHSEMMALYGAGTNATIGSDIGVINAVISGTNWNTSPVVNLTTASWAKLLWLNSGSGGNANAGMLVDIYDTTGVTLKANFIRTIGVTDSTKCRVQFNSTAATTIGAAVAVAAGDRIIPRGWGATSALGVSGIAQTTGTFAGIDNTQIPQWKMQPFDCGGTGLTFDMFQNFAAKLRGNGFDEGTFDVWGAPGGIAALANSFTSTAHWVNGAGADQKQTGQRSFVVDTQVGRLNFHSYGYLKQGEILVLARGEVVRVGAAEERTDGVKGDGLVLELQGASGTEMRAMAQFAPLPTTPFWSGRMFNFTASGNDVQG